MPEQKLTVEDCLKELREMWPNCSAEIINGTAMGFYKQPEAWVEVAVITTDYKIHGERAKGNTLDDCMAQVRAWHKEQST